VRRRRHRLSTQTPSAANDVVTTVTDPLMAALEQQSYVTVPSAHATDDGCVQVG